MVFKGGVLDLILNACISAGDQCEPAAQNACAIVVNVRTDGAAVKRNHRLLRQDQRYTVVIGGAAAGHVRTFT